MKNILVAGLGSVLMGDDGLGPHVIAYLQKNYDFPENVTISDLGTPGLALISNILGYDAVILVDTVHEEGNPGKIHRYTKETLMKMPVNPRVNPHDPAVGEALLMAEMSLNPPSDVVLVGVVPNACEYGIGLCKDVEDAVITAAEMILAELRFFGIEPLRLAHASANRVDNALAPFLA